MKERGGDIVTRVIPNRRRTALISSVTASVKPHSEVHTDEFVAYDNLNSFNGYWHKRINHAAGQYVSTCGVSTNSVEGFWAQLKRSINGTHIHVSQKHLAKYLGEFEFRHNRRHRPEMMLSELMTSFAR